MDDSHSAPVPASASSPAPAEDSDFPAPVKPSYSAIVQGNGGGAHQHPPPPPPPHLHPFPPPPHHFHPYPYPHPPPPPPPSSMFRVLPHTEFQSEAFDTGEALDFVDAPQESAPPSVSSNGHGSLFGDNKEGREEEKEDGVDCEEDGGSSVESFDSAQEKIPFAPVSNSDYVDDPSNVVAVSTDGKFPSEVAENSGNQPFESHGSGLLDQNVNDGFPQTDDAAKPEPEVQQELGIHVEAAKEPEIQDQSQTLDREVVVVEEEEEEEEVVENGGDGPEEIKVNSDSLQVANDDGEAVVASDGELTVNADSSQAVKGDEETSLENDGERAGNPKLSDYLSPEDMEKEAVENDSGVLEEPGRNYSSEATPDGKEVVEGHDGRASAEQALDSEEVLERHDGEVSTEPSASDSFPALDDVQAPEEQKSCILGPKEVSEDHPNFTKGNDTLAVDTEEVANTSDEVSQYPKFDSLVSSDAEQTLESNLVMLPHDPSVNESSQSLEASEVNTWRTSNVEEIKDDEDIEVSKPVSNLNDSSSITSDAKEATGQLEDGNSSKETEVSSDLHSTDEKPHEVHGNVDATTPQAIDGETSELARDTSVSLTEDCKEGDEGQELEPSVDNEVLVMKEEALLESDHSRVEEVSAGNSEQCKTNKEANGTTDDREEKSKEKPMDEIVIQQEETEQKVYTTSEEPLESLINQDMPTTSVDEEPRANVPEKSEVGETSEIEESPGEVIVQKEKTVKTVDDNDETKYSESIEEAEVKTEVLANSSPAKDANEKAEEIIKPKDESERNPKPSTVQSFTGTQATSAPAGLGSSIPALEATSRAIQRGIGRPSRQTLVPTEESQSNDEVSEGGDEAGEKLHMIRVKFLRLAHRLGQSAHNVVVAQVLYRLGLAEQLRGGQSTGRTGSFSFERASLLAEEQESAGAEDLDFGCTIMVLGKSGVGKSATINSLFDEIKSPTNAYLPATNKVKEIVGTIHGIKLRVIDTPGLLTSFGDQPRNLKIMSSVKRYIKKSPPDIVLYFDRLDIPSRDYGDLPLLRTITDTFGAAVWFNAIVVLTHASSAPPDGANGVPVSYEMFVAQRSHIVQQTIRQAAGDMRLMNPVSLVENHDSCRRNRSGQRVLPNGQVWKPQLLLLCFASKILAEANSLLKLQDNTPTKPFGVRSRVPPLPFLLSSLLQARAPLRHPDDQMGGADDDDESSEDEDSDSDGEEDYDDLPPFRRLTKSELNLLDKEQKNIYFEELEYRERLFIKKQLKEEKIRKKEMKRRMAALPKDVSEYVDENMEEENSSAVAVPMPDMVLPPSFDSDNPTYRYRYLDTPNQFLVRPVLETHGWDHDSGYDGINVEKMFVVAKKIPASVSGQITKDKKEANLQMECAASFKNGENKVSQAGLDIQTIGKDLAYTFRGETRFNNFKRNKTTCGLSVTVLGDTVAGGMKVENHKVFGKRAKVVVNGGALTSRSDVAYGGSLEATIRDKDYPIGQFMSTLGLSVMNWHGDLAIGGNLQVQAKAGKTMLITRGNLNNRGAGQISIRASSAEQVQMALIGLIPLLRTLINSRQSSSN